MDPRVERVGGRDPLLELVPQLLQPGTREDPVSRPLDPFRLAVEHVAQRVEPHRSVDRRGDVPSLDQLDPLPARMPRRTRVEHAAAAESRLAAQYHVVATPGHGRGRQAQLRLTRACPAVPIAASVKRRSAKSRGGRSECSERTSYAAAASAARSSSRPVPVFALTATATPPGTRSRASSSASSSVSASTASAFVTATIP